jgi:hypothetical protein
MSNVIHVQRASTEADVRAFIDRVFPDDDCAIVEGNEFDGITRLFLEPTTPLPDDEGGMDFRCDEVPLWNKGAGVILFSWMGSKTGGGVDWPGEKPFRMPDGSVDQAFDYAIMQSIRYLPRDTGRQTGPSRPSP